MQARQRVEQGYGRETDPRSYTITNPRKCVAPQSSSNRIQPLQRPPGYHVGLEALSAACSSQLAVSPGQLPEHACPAAEPHK
jgi:hypothetical protein